MPLARFAYNPLTSMIGEDRSARVEKIALGRIRNRGIPVRANAVEGEIRKLAASIRKYGLLQPIVVRPAGRDFEVVCGQRRFQAVRQLGFGEIVAVVRALDDRQAFEVAIAENARREPFSSADRTELLWRLLAMFPGRPDGELEEWLGTAAPAAASSRGRVLDVS